jgi:hypothetical protein
MMAQPLLGPQEPPQNDGTFPPLSEFFEAPVIRALKSRQDQIINSLSSRMFAGAADSSQLYEELSEIEIELERLS